jgi:drug/metabolite transporter (DMT)-like permease
MSTTAGEVGTRASERGRVLILLSAGLWSLAGVFIKSLDLEPLSIVFYRSLFAALFFLLFVRKSGWIIGIPLGVSTASYTAAVSFFVLANKLTTAANAIVLQYTAPLFVFIFSRLWLREPVVRRNALTLAMGMAGIATIFAGSAGQPDAPGVLAATFSGFLFSVYMLNLRFVRGIDPGNLTFANNLVCVLVLLPFMGSRFELAAGELVALAVMGVVQLGLPYFFFSRGVETVSLQEAALIALIEPVLNPLWVAIVVGEVPSAATLAGGGMIVLGLGLRYRLIVKREK